MRAIVCDGQAANLVSDRSAPEPSPGEALVRPTRLAIGRLDVEIARGLVGFRGVMGREFVGVVESIRSPGDAKLRGKRVIGSAASACGKCDLCLRGLSAHCRNQSIMGMRCRDGCFAEAFAIPAATLRVVPDSIDDDHAVFAHALAAAMQPARQITVEGKPYITILGDGPIGLLAAQVMSRLNASVRLVGKHPQKYSLCEKWGVKHRGADEVGHRADQDIVVDCTGSQDGFALACRLVRPRGKVIVKTLGVPPSASEGGQAFDWTPIVLNEIEVVGSGLGADNLSEALAAIARREIEVLNLISRRMKLADGSAALQAASGAAALRVLLSP